LEGRQLLSAVVTTVGYVAGADTQVAADAKGDVFGTTLHTATSAGTIFEIPAGTGQLKTLASFGAVDATNVDGVDPRNILIDAAGNLFGTSEGDTNGAAAVVLWELPSGGSAVRVLGAYPYEHTFSGGYPSTALRIDSADDLIFSLEYSGLDYNAAPAGVEEYVAATGRIGAVASVFGDGTYTRILNQFAVDPAGNVYVEYAQVDPYEHLAYGPVGLYRVSAAAVQAGVAAGSPPTPTSLFGFDAMGGSTSGLPAAITTDPFGNLYVLTAGGTVDEVLAGASTYEPVANISGAAMSTDAAGDLFVERQTATYGEGAIDELPAESNNVRTVASFGSPLDLDSRSPFTNSALTADAAGDVFWTLDYSKLPTDTIEVGEVTDVGSPVTPSPTRPSQAPTPTPTPTPSPTPTPTVGLRPTVTRSTVPATAVAGFTVRGSVRVTLTNTTAAAASAKSDSVVRVYATQTGVIDAGSQLVGTFKRRVVLGKGKAKAVTVAVRSASLPIGTYTLLTQVTDGAGDVVTAAAGPALTVEPATVTLSGTTSHFSPATLTPGRVAAVTVTVTNTGNTAAAGPVTITLGLTSDGTTLAVALTSVTRRLPIKPGRSAALRLRFRVPTTATVGARYQTQVTVTRSGITTSSIGTATVTVA
jgi:hypothetical protein